MLQTFYLPTSAGCNMYVRNWIPDTGVKAVILVAHGMAEHSGRYEKFAQAMNLLGIQVYAPDLRGHGISAFRKYPLGYLGPEDGWYKLLEDLNNLHMHVMGLHPKTPIFLMGHSMGSVAIRHYLQIYPDFHPSGALILSTAAHRPMLQSLGHLTAAFLGKLWGKESESKFLAVSAFGPYNKYFRPNRTFFDWLSRDEASVDAYVADPFCGKIFPNSFWYEFFSGLNLVGSRDAIRRSPSTLPMLWLCGDKDPVGNLSKGVIDLVKRYEARGCKMCELKVYAEARHELLQEINKEEVFSDIGAWLLARL